MKEQLKVFHFKNQHHHNHTEKTSPNNDKHNRASQLSRKRQLQAIESMPLSSSIITHHKKKRQSVVSSTMTTSVNKKSLVDEIPSPFNNGKFLFSDVTYV